MRQSQSRVGPGVPRTVRGHGYRPGHAPGGRPCRCGRAGPGGGQVVARQHCTDTPPLQPATYRRASSGQRSCSHSLAYGVAIRALTRWPRRVCQHPPEGACDTAVSQALTSWAVIRIWDSLRSPMNADPPSAAGEVRVPGAGELSESRMEALDGIDPAWCPAWGIDWQRGFHPTHAHVRAGGHCPCGRARSSCRAKTSAPGPSPNGPGGRR